MLFRCVLAALLVAQGCLAQNVRITDGQESPPHQFPHQVSIVWGIPLLIKYKHICSGSILNKDWILTSAHCIDILPKIGKIGVQAGKHIINKREDGQQFSGVELKVAHWNYSRKSGEHNIGVLKLKSSLVLNKIVAPIRLPKTGKVHTGQAILSGWGSTSKNILPKFPKVLQTVTIPIITNKLCYDALHEYPGHDVKVFDTQLCTGPLHTTIATCIGDGGDPLVQYDDNAIPELVGIASWVSYPCGSGVPSVYTRVSSYIGWINDKLNN